MDVKAEAAATDQKSGESGPLSEAERLDLEKRRLECDKLRAEIARDSRAWWKQPGYLATMLPVLVAFCGFLAAWGTGFFDQQRRVLRAEIGNLTVTRQQLSERNEQLHRQIDDAYIRLKIASANARYAIGHVRGVGPVSKADRGRIDDSVKALPSDHARLIRGVLGQQDLMNEIARITEAELKQLDGNLQAIPASEWARALRPDVDGKAYHPDGRVYDPKATPPQRPAR